MPGIARPLLDVLIAIALTVAVVLVIMVSNQFLLARGSSWQGFGVWLAFIRRPDILGTMILTALVSMAYQVWQRNRMRK